MIYDYQDKSGKNGNLEKVEFYKNKTEKASSIYFNLHQFALVKSFFIHIDWGTNMTGQKHDNNHNLGKCPDKKKQGLEGWR